MHEVAQAIREAAQILGFALLFLGFCRLMKD